MIYVKLERQASGELVSCEATGHADFAVKGEDIVCSAVTVLLRTAVQVLQDSGADISVHAEKRGFLTVKILDVAKSTEMKQMYACVADFVEKGIASVAHEYPASVKLETVIL